MDGIFIKYRKISVSTDNAGITAGLMVRGKRPTCDASVSVDFALEFDPLQLVLQDHLISFTDVFRPRRLGQQVVLKKIKIKK